MATNRGRTSLRHRRRTEDPMREFDRLPTDLRSWLTKAILPWRPQSVRRSFNRALAKTGSRALALAELDRIQRHQVARDGRQIWGEAHPFALAEQDQPG